jgi:hypothetical protein
MNLQTVGAEANLGAHDLADHDVVVELHERLTARGPTLELHVVTTPRRARRSRGGNRRTVCGSLPRSQEAPDPHDSFR